MPVSAWIIRDGHDPLVAWARWRPVGAGQDAWRTATLHEAGNDEWVGAFTAESVGHHELVVGAAVDRAAVRAREEGVPAARPDPDPLDRAESRPMPIWVDRPLARRSAWYELFPRSEGGLVGAVGRLDAIADMGFDIVYLPPVHPIGRSFRKGPRQRARGRAARPREPVGDRRVGGRAHRGAPRPRHDRRLRRVRRRGGGAGPGSGPRLRLAVLAGPPLGHRAPRVVPPPARRHHPLRGEPAEEVPGHLPARLLATPCGRHRRRGRQGALWDACYGIFEHWIDHGVRVFRVDNPHTKPIALWAWLVERLRAEHPEVFLLAEAFTRPKPMAKLGEVGFAQSYTYFTWRHAAGELREYLGELAAPDTADQFRPNFWPNTPDILAGVLRNGNRAAFQLRAVLAALLSPNWGLYSGYELCENEPASDENTEYAHAEKYELRTRDWNAPDSLAPFIGRLNAIRRAHPAFAELRTIRFHEHRRRLAARLVQDHRGRRRPGPGRGEPRPRPCARRHPRRRLRVAGPVERGAARGTRRARRHDLRLARSQPLGATSTRASGSRTCCPCGWRHDPPPPADPRTPAPSPTTPPGTARRSSTSCWCAASPT